MRRMFLVLAALATTGLPTLADTKSKAARETAEYVLRRFGRQVVREGAEVFAERLEKAALRHGDDVFRAVRQLGPRGLYLVEEAGSHATQVARVLGAHGDHGAVWIVSRPKALALVLTHGDDAARVLVKHKGIAEPLVETFGPPALRALEATGPQGGRRLAMLAESGTFGRLGRPTEVLDIIGTHGDRAMEFVWKHKGALAVTAVLTAFLAAPEPFLDGTRDLTDIVATSAVRPLAEATGQAVVQAAPEISRRTNWTLVFLAAIAGPLALASYWLWRWSA